ncbi:MAG: hypothetical protein JJT89_02110 [Nitriliruptoraceae bacterium]|nr:hypothetical protein [Nitriliruptoraceae bacterium]
MSERYVILGVAPARADWFRTVSQWSSSAVIPAEFVRCVSLDELQARLASGRAFSTVIVDGGMAGIDRDLFAVAGENGVSVLVVDEAGRRDWRELGAAGVLAARFSRDELLEVLAATSAPVSAGTYEPSPLAAALPQQQGRLVAVTGPGGTGASTLAIALAQGLAAGEGRWERPSDRRSRRSAEPAPAPSVLLADLCRVADQAMMHDSRVVVPSIQELVEAHRTVTPARNALLDQTFEVPARGYRLVLGLRRPRHWVALRPRALDSTLDSLQRLADVVVADIEPDIEGEAETGSADVEERHLLARATLTRADAVVVVGEPSMKGCFALVRTINELTSFGIGIDRILPVVNRSSWRPRARAELGASLNDLLRSSVGGAADRAVNPIHLPDKPVDQALRDGVALPDALARTLARSVGAILDRVDEPDAEAIAVPERVAPGSFSAFTAQERPRS